MLTPITVTWDTAYPDSSYPGPSGAVAFQLMKANRPVTIEDSETGETIVPLDIVASINGGRLLLPPSGGGPYLPVTLIANDDPTTVPTGTYYLVTEQLVAGSLPPWQLTIPHNAVGGTIDLSSYRPTP